MQQSLHTSKSSHSESNIEMSLEENDPALQNYFQIVFDKTLPLEIRQQKGNKTLNDVGVMQTLRLRIMIGANKESEEVKLQLTSQENIFFNYTTIITKKEFSALKKQQNLTISFEGFPQMMSKLTTLVHNQKNVHIAVLCIRRDKSAHLDFNQSVGYKFIEVLSLSFNKVSQEANREIVSYRFNLVKHKLSVLNTSLKDVHGVLKVKNLSLFQKIVKKN